jgi:hypothetical protein
VRALAVVVQTVLIDDRFEAALIEDEHPIEAFTPAAPDPALACTFAMGAISGVRITRTPWDWKT